MNKQPRLFPALVSASLFLASGPLPAAAQMRAQVNAGSSAIVPVVPAIGGVNLPSAGAWSNALTVVGPNGLLAAPSIAPAPLASAVPTAAVPAPAALTIAAQQAAAARSAESPAANAPAAAVPTAPAQESGVGRALDTLLNRPAAAVSFDGAAARSVPLITNSWYYRAPNLSEDGKIIATVRNGAARSKTFQSLNSEFSNRGGYYLIDDTPNARNMAAAAVDSSGRPVILLTNDLLNRDNGRWEDIYRGAPWEFIAAVIAREQVLHNGWYGVIPASAEKLAVSFMNMVHVFVDLTNGTSRSWATDKDFQAVIGDRTSNVQWNWFEQLVAAGRAAASGVGTNSGHLIGSKFFSWIRNYTAPQEKAATPAFQYSLWEQLKGTYHRPGDVKHGQPLPPNAPRIDQATYDQAAYRAYGADGKGNAQNGGLDTKTVYGLIIQWLRGRSEI